jgi:hypothetical protein
MRRHHPTAAPGFALGKIFEPKLTHRYAAPEDQSAVTIKRNNVIIRFHLDGDCGERFMTHSRRVKMTLALPIQTLLAQIGMPALKHERQETQLILFAELGHTMSILQLQLRLDNRAD